MDSLNSIIKMFDELTGATVVAGHLDDDRSRLMLRFDRPVDGRVSVSDVYYATGCQANINGREIEIFSFDNDERIRG